MLKALLKRAEKIPGWGILAWLWNHKTLVAIAVAAATLAYFIWLADSRGKELTEAKEALKGYKQVVADMRQWHEDTVGALERKSLNDDERNNFETEMARRNQADREAGDGPLAPVLANGFHKLSLRQAERQSRNP